jgi:hypothetical protein
MKRTVFAVLAVTVLALTAPAAFASSVHFKHGSPTFRDNGLTLTEAGTVSGVGNSDLQVNLSATGTPSATCTNPGSGEHQPAGHNPATVTLTGTQAIPASAIKNGNAAFSVTTSAPTSPVPGAPECPNAHWREDINDVAFTSATLSIVQGGQTVLSASCTFDPATSDGSVRNFSC